MTDTSLEPADVVKEPTPEPPRCLVWNWPTLILAQRSPSADQPEALVRAVVVAPNQRALDQFESFDDVRAMWVIRMTQEGQLTTESVQCLCIWRLVPDQKQRSMTALMCESGAIFIVDSEKVFEVDELTRKWFAQGAFKSARPPHNASGPSPVAEPADHG